MVLTAGRCDIKLERSLVGNEAMLLTSNKYLQLSQLAKQCVHEHTPVGAWVLLLAHHQFINFFIKTGLALSGSPMFPKVRAHEALAERGVATRD